MSTAEQFIHHLTQQPFYQGQIAHIEHIPAREARYGRLHRELSRPLQEALHGAGIRRFYTHQAQAINAVRERHNMYPELQVGQQQEPLDKTAALVILEGLLEKATLPTARRARRPARL